MRIDLTPTIIIDSREQCPLVITRFPVQTMKLDFGDYSILGHHDLNNPGIVIERKSLSDLIGSLTAERERFMREIEGLRRFRFAAIAIEAERSAVESGEFRSAANPGAMLASLDAIEVRAGIHVLWCGSARSAAQRVENLVRLYVAGLAKQMKPLMPAGMSMEVADHIGNATIENIGAGHMPVAV